MVEDSGTLPAPPEEDAADDAYRIPTCSSFDASTTVCWDFSSDKIEDGDLGVQASGNASDAGTVQFSTDLFQSAPRAGRAAISPSSQSEHAIFHILAPVPWRKVRYSFSLYIEEWGSGGYFGLLSLTDTGDGGTDQYQQYLLIGADRKGKISLYENFSGRSVYTGGVVRLSKHLPLKKWVRFALEVEHDPPCTLRATLDGVEVGRGELTIIPNRDGLIYGWVGIASYESEAVSIVVDDLALERLP